MPPKRPDSQEVLKSAENYWAKENAQGSGWADDGAPAAPEAPAEELFDLDAILEFKLEYMGSINGIQLSPNEAIDSIDAAKKNGNVAWRTGPDDEVILYLSKYGVKVTDKENKEVFMRTVMHKIGFVLHYVEDSNNSVVVLETGVPGSHDFTYYVYQAQTEEQAAEVCECLKQAFDVVYTKTTLEKAVNTN